MKKTVLITGGILAVLLIVTGALVYRVLSFTKQKPAAPVEEEEIVEILPPVEDSVSVTVAQSTTADNTVVMQVTGLDGKYESVAYELTYESEGLIKGVNSGSKPLETEGQDELKREVYLGTCSRNVCKPDPGVTSVSVVLQFTWVDGKKSQFTGDFEL